MKSHILHTTFYIPKRVRHFVSKTRQRKILSSILAVLMLLTSIRFAFFSNEAKAAWWNDNWTYRTKVTVDNSGGALTDYQTALAVSNTTNKTNSDCSDVRILDNTNNPISEPYWVDCSTGSFKVWIKHSSLSSGEHDYYVYYGNPSATNSLASTGSDVFILFDDFGGSSLDTDIWTRINSGAASDSVANSQLTITGTGDWWGTSDSSRIAVVKNAITSDYVAEAKINSVSSNYQRFFGLRASSTATNSRMVVLLADSDQSHISTVQRTSDGASATYQGDNVTSYSEPFSAKWVRNGSTLTGFVETTQVNQITSIANLDYPALTASAGTQVIFDHFFVRKYAATEPSVTPSAEEVGPGPVAWWKFDEGYGQSVDNAITDNEQQINFTTQEFSTISTTFVPTDNSLGIIHWDADKYPNSTVYFEVVARASTSTTYRWYAGLYTLGGTQVTNSQVDEQLNTNPARLRSSALTLSDDTDYTVRVKTNHGSITLYVESVRLIVVQSNPSGLETTQTQIEIGSNEAQTSNSATQLTDKKIYYHDQSTYSPTPTTYFEASLLGTQPTIEQQINIVDQEYSTINTSYSPTDNSLGLFHWDANKYPGATVYFEFVGRASSNSTNRMFAALFSKGGSQVGSSQVDAQLNTNAVRLRSGALSLTDDTDYTFRMRTDHGSITLYVESARLIIIQSNSQKITDTQTQIEIGSNQTGFTNTSAAELTDKKIYQYDQDKFTPTPESSGDIEFHASLKTESSGDTVYAELYNQTNSQVVATASHTGDTVWALEQVTNVDSDSDWDTTNDDEYIVRVYCSDGDTGGCTGSISSAKLVIYQTDANGITDLELVHQEVADVVTDTDDTYTSQDKMHIFNPDLQSPKGFTGGNFNYYYEATLKAASTTTGYAQLINRTSGSAVSNSEITTTNTNYTRVRSSDITSDLPSYPSTTSSQTLDTQVKNSTTNTTTVSNSWLVIEVSNLATSAVTAYADLYNKTDSTAVSGSEVSVTGGTWSLSRTASPITLTDQKEYVVRLRSSTNGIKVAMANAKVIFDQTDATNGVTSVETFQQTVNYPSTHSDSTYTDQDSLNQFNSSNFNNISAYFETTIKTSNGSNAAYAILKNDTDGTTISGSEVTSSSTSYERKRSGDISANLPSSTKVLDTQLKNNSTDTTTATTSWLIIQNSNVILAATNDATAYGNTGGIDGASWRTKDDCVIDKCLFYDGSDDVVTVTNSSSLDLDGQLAGGFTILAWVRVNSDGENNVGEIFNKGTNTYARITNEGSDGLADLEVKIDLATTDESITFTNAITLNKWQHIAIAYTDDSDDEATVYIDGKAATASSDTDASGAPATDSNDLLIGGSSSANYHGFIDETKVYPYERSADEIKQDFTGAAVVLGYKDNSFLTDGLVGYWKMDESSGNATDSSGNSNSLTNNSSMAYTSGKFGNAAQCDGTADYLNTGTTISGIQTVTFWVYPAAATNNYFINLINSSTYITINSSGVVSATGFSSPSIYVNGVLNGTASAATWSMITVTTSTSINANAFAVGLTNDGSNNFCTSTSEIDDVRIYNRALSPSEVAALYKWAPGPVGYWKMDEGSGTAANDSSGNGNNGSFTNSPGWGDGKFGNAITTSINGAADSVTISDPPSGILDFSDSQSYTVSTWFKAASLPEGNTEIVDKRAGVNSAGYDLQVKSDGDASCGYEVDTGSNDDITDNNNSVADGQWHHITCVMDREGVLNGTPGHYLFVDGVQSSSTDTTLVSGNSLTSEDVDIGELNGTSEYNGSIDEVKIYNYARSQEKIIEDMNAGHPAPGSPVGSALLHYKFDEGYGDTANNSGNGSITYNGDIAGSGEDCSDGGTTCPAWTNSGKFGKALDFNQTDRDYIEVAGLLGTPANITLSAWVSLDSADINGVDVISLGDYVAIRLDSSSSPGGIHGFYHYGSSNWRSIESGTFIAGDGWHHVVYVVDDTNDKQYLYLDGAQIVTGTDTESIDYTGQGTNTYIGRNGNGGTTFDYDGQMDEIKVYSFALTADQVKTEYNQGKAEVFGATSTDASNNPSWSSENEYCPPGQGSACTGPVAEWKFDEKTGQSANDTSENNNTGQLGSSSGTDSSDPTWKYQGACKKGACLEFDGSDDYVDFGNLTSFNLADTSDVTVEGWFYRDSTSHTDVILDKSDGFGGEPSYSIYISDATEKLTFRINDGTDNYLMESGTAFASAGWNHFTVVWDQDSAINSKIYINGTDDNESHTGTIANIGSAGSSNNLTIGGDVENGNYFDGKLDQIRYYNYVRTPAQIAWDYNRGGPVGWWKLDDNVSGDNKTVYDSSGFGNNGTTSDSDATLDCTVNGKRNLGCDFDGSNDYINIPNSVNLPTGDFTYSVWANQDSLDGEYILHSANSSSGNEFNIAVVNCGAQFCTRISVDDTDFDSTTPLQAGVWYHFAVTRSGSDITLYINGVQDGTATKGNALDFGSCPLLVGVDNDSVNCTVLDGLNQYWQGKIDEVRVFNYALTDKQIETLYNEGSVHFGP